MVEHLEDRLAIHHFGKVVFGLDEVGVAEAGVVEVVADAGDQACELFEVGEHFAEEGWLIGVLLCYCHIVNMGDVEGMGHIMEGREIVFLAYFVQECN